MISDFLSFCFVLFVRLVSFGLCFLFVGILDNNFSEIVKTFGNFGQFSEAELVEVLLGRASVRTHPKAIPVMDYT